MYREKRLLAEGIGKAEPGEPRGWGGNDSQRKVELMSAWILRFSGHKVTIGARRPITVLEVTTDGQETELESVEVSGEEYPGLRDLVRDQIEQRRPRLILDLGSVEKIDSDGIGEMVAVSQHAKNKGGELVFVGLQPRVSDLFRILYLDKVIPVFDSVIEAVQYLSRSSNEPPNRA